MTNYLPKGIRESGGFRLWSDRPDIVKKHNGIGYEGLAYRFEQNYSNRRIADDCGLKTYKPVKNWREWYRSEKDVENG